MGVPGVEVRWARSRSSEWISGYEVRRDGTLIGRAMRGTFLFDHSAGADPSAAYSVCAVSAEPRRSAETAAQPTSSTCVHVIDDAGMQVTGPWTRDPKAPLAHAGTTSWADGPAEAACVFEGRALTLHSRLGADGGLARVTIDGVDAGTINCYAADEIPAWPILEKRWRNSGRHEVRITVLGERDKRSRGTKVWIDAATVER